MAELFAKGTMEISASPARVWQVLTQSTFTRQYMFGTEAVTDWKVGSPLTWEAMYEGKQTVFVKGHVVEIVPERLLRYTTFGPNRGLDDVPSNYLTVIYRLTPKGAGTVLEISQGDFAGVQDSEKRFKETEAGWPEVLTNIKRIAEAP
jgi:uncharacterized protein YndB with AHSA1/START domain